MSVVVPRSRDAPEHYDPAQRQGGPSAVVSYDATVDLSERGLPALPDPNSIPHCTVLNVSRNLIQGFSLAYFNSRVHKLDISRNQIASAVNIHAFRFLEVLDLSHNHLTSVEPLTALVNIHLLNVSHNAITSLDPLSALGRLRKLTARANRVRDIPDLSRCVELNSLDLHQNHISNAENVHKLMPVHIQHLDLSENAIARLCQLTTLAALKELHSLRLVGNPCWVSCSVLAKALGRIMG